MNKRNIILIGGGGHCQSCIDVIKSTDGLIIKGVVDFEDRVGQKILGIEIIGTDEDIPSLSLENNCFLVAIGQIKDPWPRVKKYEYLKSLGGIFPVVVSPEAYVSPQAVLGEGTIIMHKAVVNAGARVGKNCIINTMAVVEHGTIIDDHCHISVGCVVNGNCRVGKRTFLGSNSVLANDINIAEDVVIGAGAVVVESVDKRGVYKGIPARFRESYE